MKRKIFLFLCMGVILLFNQFYAVGQSTPTNTTTQGAHPYYLHALSDLRAARWMLEHRPGNWQMTEDEVAAVKKIDTSIYEIKKAGNNDGKDIQQHPKVDEHPGHIDRLHEAIDFLKKAQEDVNKEEDNTFARGLRDRASKLIEEAKKLTEKALAQ